MTCGYFSGAVSQHNSQLYEGGAWVPVHREVLLAARLGRNGAHCSRESSLPPPSGCTYRYFFFPSIARQPPDCILQSRCLVLFQSASTLTGFCLPFRALHRNCADGGSDDGSWHWWRCAGVLGHGPGSERCQSSLNMFRTLSSYIRLGKLDFYQWGSLAWNSSSGSYDLYTLGEVWLLGNINIQCLSIFYSYNLNIKIRILMLRFGQNGYAHSKLMPLELYNNCHNSFSNTRPKGQIPFFLKGKKRGCFFLIF